ncbi:MAG: NADPH:quinone oxidoreductase [Actinobacteria bacterium]|uniref:zinc-binding dehydrogenase n=1 Tax=unclassified Microbacterium TaxID=2609290 RepID=UPI000C5D0050|nr:MULTISPECIES: zinc-binding dehydrogenase [unclassified Microbacterium]MBU21171.1 NADPH:quinone oxidoreductase [Microbacterium sp.]RUA25513.1 MAG: NADPH:quinone oxidoreductase [Actinomycetota bacterium]HIE61150.1 NADPH:quinone oxidoreductase [Microbacterium sp.]|tara:strand:- start:486 stop:1463 length:978 start_codon:yes stop_codon:yes gene_type:complete
MRALVQHQFGDPAEVLAVEEVELPEPGPGQVRLKVVLSPIHNHDLWTVRGDYGYKPELPARAGTEALSVVDALGEGVTGVEVGQRVVTASVFGVWSEYVIAPAAALIPVPDAVADEAAAQIISMPLSAASLLEYLDVSEGDWIVQNAANGAVGRLVAQFAASRGVRVLGLVRRGAGVDELAAVGIHDVVGTDAENWRDRVAEITGGASIRAGVDSVGGAAAGDVTSLLGENGTLVVFGAMASPTMEIPSGDVIFRQLTVRGFWGSKVSAAMDPAHRVELIREIITLVAQGKLDLPVSQIFPLEQIADASRLNFEPGRVGKVMLRP